MVELLSFYYTLLGMLGCLRAVIAVLTIAGAGAGAGEQSVRVEVRDLFGMLDPKNPAVAHIRKLGAGDSPDLPAAQSAFATYLRTRKHAVVEPSKDFSVKMAQAAMEGRWAGRTYPPGQIDWKRDAMEITLMTPWKDMAAAQAAGKASCAKAWSRQMRSWRSLMRVPETRADTGAFRTLDVGRRLGVAWAEAFEVFVRAPEAEDAALLDLVAAMCEQARYLSRHHSQATNWLVNEMFGLHTVGVLLPEFAEAAAWRKLALDETEANVRRELLPDGAWAELTPAYGNWNSNNIRRIADRAISAGYGREVPRTLVDRIDQSYVWMARIMAPDGRIPRLNDTTGWLEFDVGFGSWLSKNMPDHSVFRWIAADRQGPSPLKTSEHLADSGFVTMRTGWDRQATYVLFDVGPMGSSWHGHQDKLQVLLWRGGRELLLDNGGGPYDSAPQREWSRTSDAHNCMMVDGGGQARWRNRGRDGDAEASVDGPTRVDIVNGDPATPAPIFMTTDAYDYACAWYIDAFAPSGRGDGLEKGPRPASQRREVVLIKPDLLVVIDDMRSLDGKPHVYEARWHLPLTSRRSDPGTGTIITTQPGGPNLAIVPMAATGLTVRHDAATLKPEVLGWTYEKGAWKPAVTVRHTAQSVLHRQFITLFRILATDMVDAAVTMDGSGAIPQAVFQDGLRVSVDAAEGGPGLTVRIDSANAPLRTHRIAPRPAKRGIPR